MNSNARRAGKARMDDPKLSSGALQSIPAAPAGAIEPVHEQLEAIYRTESRRVFATLIRLLGDFDLAEEALHDSFRAALEQWPTRVSRPTRAPGWSPPAASRRSILCGGGLVSILLEDLDDRLDPASEDVADQDSVEDDPLRLIFTCCHPPCRPMPRSR